jgi:hypothetical protein
MTNRVTHEIIVHDRGMPTERVALRSSCGSPPKHHDYLSEIVSREDALPPEMASVLLPLMDMQTDALANLIGSTWMNRND